MVQLVQLGRGMGAARRGGVSAPAQPSLASIPANPLVVFVDASRFRQHNYATFSGSKSNVSSFQNGFMNWMVAHVGRCRVDVWEDHSVYANANPTGSSAYGGAGMGGSNYGLDGRTFSWNESWFPKVGASTASIVVLSCNLGSINNEGDGTFTAYCNRLKAGIATLWASGKYVVLLNTAERGVNAGGIWISGGAGRVQTHQINTEMGIWCPANSVPVVDHHGTQINLLDADHNPKSTYVRYPPDDTHWSNLGGYGAAFDAGGANDVFDAILPAFAEPDPTRAGNLLDATLPTVGGTGVANGKGTMPDGWTLDITNLTNANVLAEIVTEAPANPTRFGATPIRKLKFTFSNCSAIVGNAREGIVASIPVTGVLNSWYQQSALIETSASDGTWGGCQFSMSIATGAGAVTMAPIDGGGSQPSNIFGTTLLPVTQAARHDRPMSPWYKTTNTAMTIRFSAAVLNGADSPWVKFALPRVAADGDPQDAYRANTTTPVFTSASTLSTPEESAGTFPVTCSAPIAGYKVTGTDAALFSITNAGVLSWNALDYEIPTDADTNNDYVFTITATPVNPDKAQITQSFTLTVTDINDGFTDQFTYAQATTDLAAVTASPWTRLGTLNAIRTNAATGRVQNNSAIATTYYFAPQQGTNVYEQTIIAKIGDNATKMSMMILMNAGATKFLRAIEGGTGVADWIISDEVGTIATVAGLTDLYKTKASFDSFTFRVYGTNLEVYQNAVLVKTIDLTSRLAAGLNACYFSGLRNSGSGSGTLESWNNRVSPATYTAVVGLRALTLATTTGTALTPFVSVVTGKNTGAASSITISNLKKDAVASSDDWFTDGSVIRASSPAAGTWTMDITENYPGSVNNNRVSTGLSVVIT